MVLKTITISYTYIRWHSLTANVSKWLASVSPEGNWKRTHPTSARLTCVISALVAAFGYNTHTRLTALFPGLPRWASTRKAKLIWILLKQETVSGSGISWAIRKSAPRSRQITTPAFHHSLFCRLDALPAAQPTASERAEKSNFRTQLNCCLTRNGPLKRCLRVV